MILAKLRSSAQFLIRVFLGALLLPVICSACLLLSLAALCSDYRHLWRFPSSACAELWNWSLGRWPVGALRACFSRIRREKHASESPQFD
jgi:hypothetical protein